MSSNNKSDAGGSSTLDPIKKIEKEQVHLLALCDRLEEIADGLPCNLSPFRFKMLAQELRRAVPQLHHHMEKLLFPILKKRALPEDGIDEIIGGFLHEHAMDDGYVLGVLEILDQLAAGPVPDRRNLEYFEAIGYQLRGFFEALRRHLRWQRFIVVRLARQRLSEKDLIELDTQISTEGS